MTLKDELRHALQHAMQRCSHLLLRQSYAVRHSVLQRCWPPPAQVAYLTQLIPGSEHSLEQPIDSLIQQAARQLKSTLLQLYRTRTSK